MSYYPDVQEVKHSLPIIDRQRSEIEKRKPYKFPKQYISYQTFLELVVDTAEQTYCIFSDYPTLERKIGNINEDGDLGDRDRQIIGNLSHLALQSVMSIEFLPEAIVLDAKPSESISKGFGKKSPSGNYWQIRQIVG